jgi:aminoglycoside phosphotransferase (APT) family kinase protein
MRELGEAIGRGKEAEVYAFGSRVLKLYREGVKGSAFREAGILAALEAAGVPAPRVFGVEEHEGRWGVLMERISGAVWAQAMLAGDAAAKPYIEAMASLQAGLHVHTVPALPTLGARLRSNIGRTPLLGEPVRRRLLAGLAEMPGGDRLCHGDFHPWNILGSLEAPMVIDWLDASLGVPAADACRSYVLMAAARPHLAEAYADAYAALANIGRGEIDDWLPFVAAARLAEGVPKETDALVAMAEQV